MLSATSREIYPLTIAGACGYHSARMEHAQEIIQNRITASLAAMGISMREASIRAGMNPDTLGKFMSGKTQSLKANNLTALAEALDVPLAWLSGTSDDMGAPLDTAQPGILFGGIVEAGAFRANDSLDQTAELRRVDVAPDPRFPARSQYAFEVVGDSMTKANIFEGMYVLAVDIDTWERTHGGVPDGRLVVVARNRNGDPERELTVKMLRIFTDRIELQPQSGNPRHSPIIFPLPMQENSHGEAQILAVVLQAVRLY